eukprot:6202384-Pleurochrysis_carterae.AAC.1
MRASTACTRAGCRREHTCMLTRCSDNVLTCSVAGMGGDDKPAAMHGRNTCGCVGDTQIWSMGMLERQKIAA